MVRFFLAMAFFASVIAAASATETSLRKGQNFYRARAALLRNGWKPIETFDKFPVGGELQHSWGDAEPFYKNGLKEVASCTGTDANYCIFNYRKDGRCLYLVTDGEYGAPGARYMPTVDNWWTYPFPANGGCSDEAAHKVPLNGNRHSIP